MSFAKLVAVAIIAMTLAFCTPLCGEVARNETNTARLYVPARLIVQSAATIFSGTVLKVEHLSPAGSPGITQITFRVGDALRGVRRGQKLTVREWAGLWNSGERYRTGERVLLFLYPRSKLGLTSPVGGAPGRYEIDGAGRVLVSGSIPRPKPIRIEEFASAIRRAVEE